MRRCISVGTIISIEVNLPKMCSAEIFEVPDGSADTVLQARPTEYGDGASADCDVEAVFA